MLAVTLVLPPMLLAYGSRSVGLSLALAVFVSEAVRHRRPRPFGVVALLGFAAGVVLLTLTFYDSRAYGNQFRLHLPAYWSNLKFYLHTPAYLWAGSPAPLRYSLAAATAVVVFGQWLRRLAADCSIVEIYAPCALLPVLVYSSAPNARYLLPVLMLYFIYFFEGIEFLAAKWPASLRVLPAAAGVVLAIGCITNLRGMERGPFPQGPEQPTFTDLRRSILTTCWSPGTPASSPSIPVSALPGIPKPPTMLSLTPTSAAPARPICSSTPATRKIWPFSPPRSHANHNDSCPCSTIPISFSTASHEPTPAAAVCRLKPWSTIL